MSSNFACQFTLCALILLQVHGDVTTVNGTLGGFVILHLEYRDLEHPAYLTWKKGNTSLSNWTDHTDKFTIFSNGTLALKNTQKKDEGQYTVSVYNTTSDLVYQRIYQLHVHGHINKETIPVTGIIGGSVDFPLGIENLKDLTDVIWVKKLCVKAMPDNTSSTDCDIYCNKMMCLRSGSLQLMNVSKEDEGEYEFTLTNTIKKYFLLKVSEPAQIPVVHIHCLPDGRGELSCEGDGSSSASFRWMLNGHSMNPTEACTKACPTDDGKKIILEKGATGELVCLIFHGDSISQSSPIEMMCDEGDLLEHPLFLYILVACGGGAIVLAVLVSLITCCYQKSKQKFIPVPSEEEKEERMTMSVISSEETKSPPNGDRHEASSAPAASPPNLENTETCQGLEAEHEMEAESEATPDPEVVVDINNQEFLCDSFPDPIDP